MSATPSPACAAPLTEKQKMLSGALCHASDTELQRESATTQAWLARYNAATERTAMARTAGRATGGGGRGERRACAVPLRLWVQHPPGAGVFINFNGVILDVAEVTIGDQAPMASGVQILAADHPRDPALRRAGLELGRPVHIGRNVWIGAGALVRWCAGALVRWCAGALVRWCCRACALATTPSSAQAMWSRVTCPPAPRWSAAQRGSRSQKPQQNI